MHNMNNINVTEYDVHAQVIPMIIQTFYDKINQNGDLFFGCFILYMY